MTPRPQAAETVTCTIDGRERTVPRGRTASAAMVLDGDGHALRRTRFTGQERGMFCGIGVCYDCLVRVDGSAPLRGCLVEVEDGMEITRIPQEDDAAGGAR